MYLIANFRSHCRNQGSDVRGDLAKPSKHELSIYRMFQEGFWFTSVCRNPELTKWGEEGLDPHAATSLTSSLK